MTEVNLNATVDGYRGSIGKLVFKKYKGRTIVSTKPVITKEPSPEQLAQRQLFKEAVAFAKFAMADPALREFYEPIALQREISVYALAIGDFLKEPSIKPLDLSLYKGQIGDPILIRTIDDIGVAEVEVTLNATDGTEIEKGKAVETGTRTGHWVYTATAPVALGSDIFIKVVGVDHAGHRAQITESPTVGTDE